jgi:two-component system CheB/CheR fusion protein
MANLQMGVAVLDKDLRVQLWNRRAEDLWGIRSEEAIGQPLLALDIGLPMGDLAQPLRETARGQNGHVDLKIGATNRRGRRFTCRVQATVMSAAEGGPGVIVLMEPLAEPAQNS